MSHTEFPEDCIQFFCDAEGWWQEDQSKELVRGQLVWAHVQFFSEIPLQLIPERVDDRDHKTANFRALPLRANQKPAEWERLVVAALPRRDGADGFLVNRAKRRPCLILGGVEPTRVLERDSRGQPNWSVAPFALAVPYYSADQDGRAGYRPELVEKIKHARFRQLFYDCLPLQSTRESILRLDQAFPLSHQPQAYEATGYRLSDRAQVALDDWLDWHIKGALPDGVLKEFREFMHDMDTETPGP